MTRKPFRIADTVEHPGKMLAKKYLPAIGIDKQQATVLSHLARMSRKYAAALLKGKVSITPEASTELGRVFDTSPAFFQMLQDVYDSAQIAERDSARQARRNRESVQREGPEAKVGEQAIRPSRV